MFVRHEDARFPAFLPEAAEILAKILAKTHGDPDFRINIRTTANASGKGGGALWTNQR